LGRFPGISTQDVATNAMLHTREAVGSKPPRPSSESSAKRHVLTVRVDGAAALKLEDYRADAPFEVSEAAITSSQTTFGLPPRQRGG
jgi:hypothetical protein